VPKYRLAKRSLARLVRNDSDSGDQLTFLQEASEAVKAEARAGKCWQSAEKE
jgi:hypothetical protein